MKKMKLGLSAGAEAIFLAGELGVGGNHLVREHTFFGKRFIGLDQQFFDKRMWCFLKETTKLGVVREDAVAKAAKIAQDRSRVKKADKRRDGVEAFKRFNNKGSDQGMLRNPISDYSLIEFGDVREIELIKEGFVFFHDRKVFDLLKGDKKRN